MVTRRTFLAGAAAAFACPAAWGRARPVKVGVCTRDVAGAAKYGFDYIEPPAAEIAAMSEDQFREFSDTVLASPLRCHAFNSFIRRPDLKVVGPEVQTSALKEYLEGCLPRCRRLGASIVVWGSAGSRNVPEGFPREQARDQIAAFLKMAGEAARRSHVIVAIEPLRRQESNILNTGAEALEIVRRVNHPNIRMIIDYFHLREENEDPRIIEMGRREIVHLHFANPHGRGWPHDLVEDDHYAAFFGYLKKTGYSGGISIEGQGSFEKDGKASREFFRQALVDGNRAARNWEALRCTASSALATALSPPSILRAHLTPSQHPSIRRVRSLGTALIRPLSFICPAQRDRQIAENKNPGCSHPEILNWTSRP